MNNSYNSNRGWGLDLDDDLESMNRGLDIPSIDHFLALAIIQNRPKHLRFSDLEWVMLTRVIECNKRATGSIVWRNVKRELEEAHHAVLKKIKSKYYRLRRKAVLERLGKSRDSNEKEKPDPTNEESHSSVSEKSEEETHN